MPERYMPSPDEMETANFVMSAKQKEDSEKREKIITAHPDSKFRAGDGSAASVDIGKGFIHYGGDGKRVLFSSDSKERPSFLSLEQASEKIDSEIIRIKEEAQRAIDQMETMKHRIEEDRSKRDQQQEEHK
jgi:hypothetical protein